MCRAEAYIVTGAYDKAVAELDLWMRYQVYAPYYQPLTREVINSYYGGLAYYRPEAPTPKKELHPLNFTFAGNGTEQENFLHCLLHFRRIETIQTGLRWADVKRYGIKIYRRDVYYDGSHLDPLLGEVTGNPTQTVSLDALEAVTDSLTLNDPRRAVQIPPDVITAGMTPNPR
jgi:hypothetical protein